MRITELLRKADCSGVWGPAHVKKPSELWLPNGGTAAGGTRDSWQFSVKGSHDSSFFRFLCARMAWE